MMSDFINNIKICRENMHIALGQMHKGKYLFVAVYGEK